MDLPSSLQHLVRENEPLAPYTWLGIGGPARFFAEPTSQEELVGLVRVAHAESLPVRILGGGSNLLVRESGVDGLVLALNAATFSQLEVRGKMLVAGGGAKLVHVVTHAAGRGLAGLEPLVAIPGTVGGAVMGNAGSAGAEISEVIDHVVQLSASGEVSTRYAKDIRFSHRQTDLDSLVVLQVAFALETAEAELVTKRTQQLWIVRRAERPGGETQLAVPFIDPDGASVATLIEHVGLRGTRRGAAELDSTNSSYLIVRAGAKSEDVLGLVDTVREQVFAQTGIDLQMGLKVW